MAGVMLPISLVTKYFTSPGAILAGGLLYVYDAGTTTPRTTYTDSALGTPNANPHVLDSAGCTTAEFWVASGVTVKLIVKTSAGVQVGPTLDNIPALNDVSSTGTVYYGATSGGTANAQTLTFSGGPSSYAAGNRIVFVAGATNTGATTINVNGLGAKAIQNRGIALVGGEIITGKTYEIIYTGTAFQLSVESSVVASKTTVTCAATMDFDAASGAPIKYLLVSGSTGPVTGITLTNGHFAFVTFDSTPTFTHGASLLMPGSANVTFASGGTALFMGEASAVVRCLWAQPTSGLPMLTGKHTLPVQATAMVSSSTNGAGSSITESTTNKVMVASKDFDQTTSESVQFGVPMPKSWNEGTVTAQFYWTADSGTGTVTWGIQGVACSDDDAIDAAFGTAVTVTDTLISTGDMHVSAETSAMTIAGTPADNDYVFFKVYRDIADTLNADARLISVKVFVTYNLGNDA